MSERAQSNVSLRIASTDTHSELVQHARTEQSMPSACSRGTLTLRSGREGRAMNIIIVMSSCASCADLSNTERNNHLVCKSCTQSRLCWPLARNTWHAAQRPHKGCRRQAGAHSGHNIIVGTADARLYPSRRLIYASASPAHMRFAALRVMCVEARVLPRCTPTRAPNGWNALHTP